MREGASFGRFGYTGQVYLPEAKLLHYKARAYDPMLGRFLQPDPIGTDGGINLYAYVGGDPVNRTDPFGQSWIVAIRAGIGAATAVSVYASTKASNGEQLTWGGLGASVVLGRLTGCIKSVAGLAGIKISTGVLGAGIIRWADRNSGEIPLSYDSNTTEPDAPYYKTGGSSSGGSGGSSAGFGGDGSIGYSYSPGSCNRTGTCHLQRH